MDDHFFMNLLFIGNFTLDNIITPERRLLLRQLGGNSVYSAIGASIWRNGVGVLSQIPENYPAELLEFLEQQGLDLRYLITRNKIVPTEEWFFYSKDGSRKDGLFASSEIVKNKKNGAFLSEQEMQQIELVVTNCKGRPPTFSFGDLVKLFPLTIDRLDGVDFSPIEGCHLATNAYEVHLSFAKRIKEINPNIFITLDPALYLRNISDVQLRLLLENVDAFLPSEVELNTLFPHLNPEQSLMHLADYPSQVMGVKLGEKGSKIFDRSTGKIVHVPAYRSFPRNLNGAGDAYCGGFLAGMVDTGDPILAAKYGTISASLVIERESYQSMAAFTRDMALDRLERLENEI
jgi:ribokinase